MKIGDYEPQEDRTWTIKTGKDSLMELRKEVISLNGAEDLTINIGQGAMKMTLWNRIKYLFNMHTKSYLLHCDLVEIGHYMRPILLMTGTKKKRKKTRKDKGKKRGKRK
jgi:hypothetical protein